MNVPRRRGGTAIRFSLRAALLGVTFLGVYLGIIVHRARTQRAALDRLVARGAFVGFHYQEFGLKSPPGPVWLRRSLGDEYFTTPIKVAMDHPRFGDDDVAILANLTSLESVSLYDASISDSALSHLSGLQRLEDLGLGQFKHPGRPGLTGAGLVNIRHLRALRDLQLQAIDLSDGGIEHLAGLSQLVHLSLYETKIGDDDLPYLYSLKNLRTLNLSGTNCTESGVEALKSQLPKCKVY